MEMEKSVVSLDIAKQLKEAGFPQDSAVAWMEVPVNKPEHRWQLKMPWQGAALNGCPAALTAQELAAQLPRMSVSNKFGIYTASYPQWAAQSGRLPDIKAEASTMADALALLWLKLRETEA